jgi:uncharacterized membrane protein
VTGLLAVIPFGVTLFILIFLKNLFSSIGRFLIQIGGEIYEKSSGKPAPEWNGWLLDLVAVVLVVAAIYGLGVITANLVGKRLFLWLESFFARIPFVKTIYGSVRKLVDLMNQGDAGENQRVVFIDFPSPEMKAIGLVTRTMTDRESGTKLAAVYVPTTPNPTNGYLEVVPVDRLTPTDWTFDEAMAFVVSGGATAPESVQFERPKENAPGLQEK